MTIIKFKMKEFGQLSCKEWGFKAGLLVLKDVKLLNPIGYEINIGRAEINKNNFYLENVDLSLKDKVDLSQFLKPTDFNIVIKNGLLSLNENSEKIPWELDKKNDKTKLKLLFDHKPLEIVMEKNIISTSFESLSPHALLIFLKDYLDWEVADGLFEAQNLQFDFNEKKLRGTLRVKGLNAKNEKLLLNVQLDEAQVDFDGQSCSFKKLETHLSDHEEICLKIEESHLAIREGQILPCEVPAVLMGLAGKISFEQNGIHIDFEGTSNTYFPNDFVKVQTKIFTHEVGTDIKGSILVGTHCLDFGGHLGENKVAWFKGKEFALETFLTPFLLKNTRLNLSGLLDFEGTIDPEGLTIYYLGKDIVLENEQFCLKCPYIGPHLNGFHYLDFKEKKSFGHFALKEGTYIQKNYGFTLENCFAQVLFQDQKIELKGINTNFQDLDLKGDVTISLNKEKPAELVISAPEYVGSLASAKELLNRFIPSFFWSIPLEGRVSSEKGGLFFHFILGPKTNLLDAQICGQLQGHFLSKFFSLNDYKASFDYDKNKNKMTFEEGLGSFSLKGKRYNVKTQKLELFPQPCLSGQLDLLAERENEFFQILGKMEQNCFSLSGNLIDLEGTIEGSCIEIDRFKCQDYEGAAKFDFEKHQSLFELASKEMGQLKFEGLFDRDKIEGDLSFGGICLTKLLKNYEKLWNPKGKITGKAKFHWDFKERHFQLKALSNFEDLSLAGIGFGKGVGLQCCLSSEEGLIVEGLEVETNDEAGRYKLGKLHYNEESQKIKFDELDFSFPKEKITYVTAFLKKLMPDKVTDEMISWIEGLKKEGDLEGKVSMEVEPDRIWVHLALKDGQYFFQGKEHEVRNFLLTMTPHHVEVNTDYIFKDKGYFISFHSDPLFNQGKLQLKETRNATESLLVNWRKTNLFHIEEIKGKFLGLAVNLKENSESVLENLMAFRGKVEIDWKKCRCLLPQNGAAFIQKMDLGSGYSLEGDFIFSPTDLTSLIFSGRLSGSCFQIGNLCLQSLNAEVLYTPKSLEIKNLRIEDDEAKLKCPKIEFKELDRKWQAYIPHVNLSHFRLSKLREGDLQNGKKSYFKPTTIQSFNLYDFKGVLGERKSFEGYGEVEFSHVSRKTFFSTLLFLPTEITARLGLDLNLLVPARGKIRYKIQDSKINLTQFRSMYSEGKRSRFYLAEGQPAFIDFDGNMNMKIKMKQYNLLMKVAEFFVISVKGTVKQPAISFTNLFEASFDENEE